MVRKRQRDDPPRRREDREERKKRSFGFDEEIFGHSPRSSCLRGERGVFVIDVTQLGKNGKFFVIAGPCVIEGSDFLLKTAKVIKGIADSLDVQLVFKSSYDKANRTSGRSFRGPGLKKGLVALAIVKERLAVQ